MYTHKQLDGSLGAARSKPFIAWRNRIRELQTCSLLYSFLFDEAIVRIVTRESVNDQDYCRFYQPKTSSNLKVRKEDENQLKLTPIIFFNCCSFKISLSISSCFGSASVRLRRRRIGQTSNPIAAIKSRNMNSSATYVSMGGRLG